MKVISGYPAEECQKIRYGKMTKPKRAVAISYRVFSIYCPDCGSDLEAQSGSLMWLPEDYEGRETVRCYNCETEHLMPLACKKAPLSGRERLKLVPK